MPALLDTSVLVRYLTQSPPDQGAEASGLLDGAEDLLVPTVALAETAFALGHFYGVGRADTVDLLVALLGKGNVGMLDVTTELAVEALMLCRPSGRVSFADALEWAVARHSGWTSVYTFDRSFPGQGIDRRVLGRRNQTR